MKKRTKVMAMLLAGAMVVSAITPVDAFAAKANFTKDGLKYTVKNKKVTITGYEGEATSLKIPQKIGKNTVTTIGKKAFQSNKKLKTVTIPKTITAIQYGAFGGTKKLSEVKVASGSKLKKIDTWAFGRSSIKKFKMPNSVKTLGTDVFAETRSLSSVTLSSKLEYIPQNSFWYSAIKTINIPASVKRIENAAFNASGLEKVTGGDSVEEIYPYAFGWCWDLNDISFADTVKYVGENAFASSALGSLEFSADDAYFDSMAFEYNNNLATLKLPASVSSLEYDAFGNCPLLYDIKMPTKINRLVGGAFHKTKWAEEQKDDVYIDEFLYMSKSGKSNVEIKAGTKQICEFAFDGQKSLTSVTIPEGVESICEGAFFDTGLKSITLPSTVTRIDPLAFGYDKYEFARDYSDFYDENPDTAWDDYIKYQEEQTKKDNVISYNTYYDYSADIPTSYCSGFCTKVKDFTIYVPKGSPAEEVVKDYCDGHGFTYVAQ